MTISQYSKTVLQKDACHVYTKIGLKCQSRVEDCVINTGIEDLAHQHDHYLYGMPKKENEHESGIDPIKALRGSTRGKNLTEKLLKLRREDLELEEAKGKRR